MVEMILSYVYLITSVVACQLPRKIPGFVMENEGAGGWRPQRRHHVWVRRQRLDSSGNWITAVLLTFSGEGKSGREQE